MQQQAVERFDFQRSSWSEFLKWASWSGWLTEGMPWNSSIIRYSSNKCKFPARSRQNPRISDGQSPFTASTFTSAAKLACNSSCTCPALSPSSLNVYSMSSGRTSAAVFTQSKTLKMQWEPLQTGNCLAHSGHALMSGFGCSCFRPQSGHPCCFVVWKLSSFRLRHLTAVRTFENQIVSHSGVSDRRSQTYFVFPLRS